MGRTRGCRDVPEEQQHCQESTRASSSSSSQHAALEAWGHLPGVSVPSITRPVFPEVPTVPLLLPGVTNLGSRDCREQHKAGFGAGGGPVHPVLWEEHVLSQENIPVWTQRRKGCIPSTQKCVRSEKAADCSPAHPWSPPSLKSFAADRKNTSHKQGCSGPE